MKKIDELEKFRLNFSNCANHDVAPLISQMTKITLILGSEMQKHCQVACKICFKLVFEARVLLNEPFGFRFSLKISDSRRVL